MRSIFVRLGVSIIIAGLWAFSAPGAQAQSRAKAKKQPAANASQEACAPGKLISPDTAGNCCWPGQAWSGTACVGEPTSCPQGLAYDDQTQGCEVAACPDEAMVRAVDGIHCCWPGQGWSSARGMCVGNPVCPEGYLPEEGGCEPEPEPEPGPQESYEDGFSDELPRCSGDTGDGEPGADECVEEAEAQRDSDDIFAHCGEIPERYLDYLDERGCPISDRDGDGIPDHLDQCPDEPEDFDGFEDEDGCPELDNDSDGVPDTEDLCPDEMEDGLGKFPADGCAIPPNEKYAMGFFNDDDAGTIMLKLSSISSPRGDMTYISFAPSAHYQKLSYGIDIGFGWGDMLLSGQSRHAENRSDGDDEDTRGGMLGHLYLGIRPFEWPMDELAGFSLLNPIIGVHAGFDGVFGSDDAGNDADFRAGVGWYIRNHISWGDFTFGAEYRDYRWTVNDATRDENYFFSFLIGFYSSR